MGRQVWPRSISRKDWGETRVSKSEFFLGSEYVSEGVKDDVTGVYAPLEWEMESSTS